MATVYCAAPHEVEESFAREFPAVLHYARQFPLRDIELIALIAQRGEAEAYLHTDSDGYWGMRFYLATAQRDALYFCLARERDLALPRRANDWSGLVDVERRLYAGWPEGNRPYCVNSVRAAHGVDATSSRLGERIACLVIPRNGYDEPRLLELLETSTSRFHEHQVWYA